MIDNARVVGWTDAVARPLAERIRDLKAELDDALTTWYGGLNTATPNTSEPITNNREKQGVATLTGADLNNLITQAAGLAAVLNGPGVAGVINKPCVRPLQIVHA